MNRVEAGAVRDLVAYLSRYPESDRAAAAVALSRLSEGAKAQGAGLSMLGIDRATDLLSASGPSDLRLVEPLPEDHGERVEVLALGAFETAKRIVAERNAMRGWDGGDRLLALAVTWEEAETVLDGSSAADLRGGRLTEAQEAAAAAGLCGRLSREALEAYAAAHQKTAVAQSEYVAPAPSTVSASGAAL
ncbi:hypothetical protein [Ruania zhangjianzhongii]|uniref:hypothetical protein n=1 Tax=Ruania zhangjianzhongii TaxID=2603206 RepID=UPI0011D279B6|nr:hypothetical protein [Ruania zhangjianzhongii]